MQRTILMLTPDQRKKLDVIAKRENVSVAEVNRRAINQYIEMSSEEMKALDELGNVLLDSTKGAMRALERAEKKMDQFLKQGGKK